MTPTPGGRASQNGGPSNNPQTNSNAQNLSEQQRAAVVSEAASIIGVSVETFTSPRPDRTSDIAFYPVRPVLEAHDSIVDFQDASYLPPSSEFLFPRIDTDTDTLPCPLEHQIQNDWPFEVFPYDQERIENGEVIFQQLLGHESQNSASLFQNTLQSMDWYNNVPNSSSIQNATPVSHRTQPLYPQDSMEIPNLQQFEGFPDLFGNAPQYFGTDYLETSTDISLSNATSIPSMNADDILDNDETGILGISTPLPPSQLFPRSEGNYSVASQGLFLADENPTPSLQSGSVTNESADHTWLWIDDNLELHDSTTDIGTTRGADFGVPLERISTSSSEVSGSSWVIPTPPTPSSPDSRNRSPNISEPSTNQEPIGISSTETSLAATSTAIAISTPPATSSNFYTQGLCTREWIIPKRRRKRPVNSQHCGKDSKKTAPRDQVPRRRGKFKTEEEKQGTALTRELSACIRCRVQRIRCEPDPSGEGPCLTCKRVAGLTMCKLPCLRYKLTAATLFRDQKCPSLFLSQRWQKMEMQDIAEWASPESKIVTMNSPNLGPGTFTLEVREFVPVEGDRMEEVHVNDRRRKIIKLPPYAMVSLKNSSDRMREHLKANVNHFISATVDEHTNPLMWYTYRMALQRARESPRYNEKRLLRNSLELWAAGRFWSNPLHIVGSETLGVHLDDDPSSPYHARVPEIPVMLAQSHVIMSAGVMGPLQREVLHQLQTMVLANDKRNWLTIYLTVFLLLHNCALITRQNEKYAREINFPTRFANPESISDLHKGALIILAHFHYCNKGKLPFSLADNPQTLQQLKKIAELNDEQTKFVQMTSIYVQNIRDDTKRARDELDFGHDMYFVSQMFDEQWMPSPIA